MCAVRTRGTGRFLSDRGFDDKWVHKEERKKDIWEEVKTGKKKQMSGAEKRARAAAISQQALKNADAVRVDIDGQALNKLLEKQARKEGMGERGQEPKPAKTGEKPAKKAAAPAPAPAQKKEKVVPFVTSVPLAAKHVRSELSSIMAKHENTYAQMIALGELVHEAFEPHRIDLVWDEHVGLGATPRSWLQRPASLLAKDTVAAIVEWLDQIQASHLAEVAPREHASEFARVALSEARALARGLCMGAGASLTYAEAYAPEYIYAYTHTYIHTYTQPAHTHTHTHTHTLSCSSFSLSTPCRGAASSGAVATRTILGSRPSSRSCYRHPFSLHVFMQ